MQRNLLSLLLLFIVVSGGIISCNRTDKAAIAIPKDASFVVHVNLPALTSKVSWQDFQQNALFKKATELSNGDSLAKQLLQDPASSGIDTQADLAFFMKKQGAGNYMVFEGAIKDAAAFETMNKKINKGAAVTKKGDINLMIANSKGVVAWNDKRFVFMMDAPVHAAKSFMSQNEGGQAYSVPVDSLQLFSVQLFDLDKKNNLLNDDRFVSAIKEPGEIHYWINAEQYYSGLEGFMSLLKMSVLFEGNVYATALHFDEGKITFTSKAWFNDELTKLLNKYDAGTISESVINRIPSQTPAAVFATRFSPVELKEFIKLLGVDGFVNSFLNESGYSIDEFVKANKGDLVVSVTGMETTPAKPSVLVATSVNDRAAFDKLVNILKTYSQQFSPGMANAVTFQLNNDWFAAGNSPEQVNGFLAGKDNHLPVANRIAGHAFGGYVDVQQILKTYSAAIPDSTAKVAMDASMKMWQDVEMTGDRSKDGVFTGKMTINLVDKKTNSLKQLNQYIDTMTKLFDASHGYSDTQAAIVPAQ